MSVYAAEMHLRDNVKMICSRVQTLLRQRRKQKRGVEISAPFDFKLEPVSLPGVSQDELMILREKAAASCISVQEDSPRSSMSMSSWEANANRWRSNTPPHVPRMGRRVW
ncbi:hypothetical protein K4F52_010220 [Lecanicillium sp. MT-2017a]|nr:hypothetical protein K4F52_010220 [Lecanicillium sp. MT-2017a]